MSNFYLLLSKKVANCGYIVKAEMEIFAVITACMHCLYSRTWQRQFRKEKFLQYFVVLCVAYTLSTFQISMMFIIP